jgi:membrane-associated phospholipid phosphatase
MKKGVVVCLLAISASQVFAEDSVGDFLSGNGTKLFLAYGTYRSFRSDNNEGLRCLDTLLSATLVTEGLKRLTRVERPDRSSNDSFPSSHATATFAMATFLSENHPKEAPYWFLGATLISQSRVDLGRHRQVDILTGAAIGYFMAKAELRSKKGFFLQGIPGQGPVTLGFSARF